VLLKNERESRQALEKQMAGLQKQLQQLTEWLDAIPASAREPQQADDDDSNDEEAQEGEGEINDAQGQEDLEVSDEGGSGEVEETAGVAVMDGYLEKLSELGNNWKRRYVVLHEGGPLFYFEHEDADVACGVVPLSNAKIMRKVEMNGVTKKGCFSIRVARKSFLFRAKDEEEKETWCKALQDTVRCSEQPLPNNMMGSFDLSPDQMKQLLQTFGTKGAAKPEENNSEAEYKELEPEPTEERHNVFEGFLEKKSELANNWKRRYFVLREGGPLYYFESPTEGAPVAGVIDLTSGSRLKSVDKKPNCFILRSSSREFVFRATSLEEKEKWCQHLRDNMTEKESSSDETEPKSVQFAEKDKTEERTTPPNRRPMKPKRSPVKLSIAEIRIGMSEEGSISGSE
jgi:hypothetical protein